MQTERRIELSWKFFADSESASKGGCKFCAESQLIDGICNQTGKCGNRFVDVLWCDISDIRTGKCAVKNMRTGEQQLLNPQEAADHILATLAADNGPLILEK